MEVLKKEIDPPKKKLSYHHTTLAAYLSQEKIYIYL